MAALYSQLECTALQRHYKSLILGKNISTHVKSIASHFEQVPVGTGQFWIIVVCKPIPDITVNIRPMIPLEDAARQLGLDDPKAYLATLKPA